MEFLNFSKEDAMAENDRFDKVVIAFLLSWVNELPGHTVLQFGQPLAVYAANDILQDFFLTKQHAFVQLLTSPSIVSHLSRPAEKVYFDLESGEPLMSLTEQRIYNLSRRLESETMHIPFRSIHPKKQTELGDIAPVSTYSASSEELRYNSGNYFASRPANALVFDENSKRCVAKEITDLHILFKRGYMEDRLQEVKTLTTEIGENGESQLQFFVICSRHSVKEGHYGVSLLIMDPGAPDIPVRIIICDTILKDLPHHPRWWNHFIAEYKHVFGDEVTELLEDLSHPLQKVNITGDIPYRHDWDCPYYAASMADALADLVKYQKELLLSGSVSEIHDAMKEQMPDYYHPDRQIKDRHEIRAANRLKRWNSGKYAIEELLGNIRYIRHEEDPAA